MAKPFKLSGSSGTGPARDSGGRFLRAALPGELVTKYPAEKGFTDNEALRALRVPDRMVGEGKPKNVAGPGATAPAPVYPDALPWPKAEPFNDANKVPFKFR
jgi:hypothetical protein